ncbi:MAG: 23S rRNA pseudouridine(2604) synthase RluF [Chitinophagales bacterium]|nr:23S rRNA pseudouridine(2604) synthase RluF [Chitinophagales bacterium]
MDAKKGTRINKYLSEIGYCSRREADRMIEQKRVRVNGKIPVSATPVKSGDKIVVDGQQLDVVDNEVIYLAFNKPVGIVCTTDETEKDNIISYVNYPRRIFPIGRLDKPSEGLIFLTSDGDIVNKILRAGNKHEKEYLVTVNKPVTPDFIDKMSNGVPIMGQRTKKCHVEAVGVNSFRIILVQGLNRQIRRMCEYLGYEVKKLKRTRIMNIKLDVPSGQWRDLTEAELKELKESVKGSTKTAKKKNTPKRKVPFDKKANPRKKASRSGQRKRR